MKTLIALLFIVALPLMGQKSFQDYFSKEKTHSTTIESPIPQVAKEVEIFLKNEKSIEIVDLKIEDGFHPIEKEKRMINFSFSIKPKMKLYKLDCFPMSKFGKDDNDRDWVEVSFDTSKFRFTKTASIMLTESKKSGVSNTQVNIHFSAETNNIDSYNEEGKFVYCKMSDVTSRLKSQLISKFK